MPYKDDPEADPPLQPRYSDDPPAAGPPMAAFYTDDPSRTRLDRRHDDWGIEGGGSESVGIVGSAHANRFRGIAVRRNLATAVCLILVGLLVGIAFVGLFGVERDRGVGGAVAEGGNGEAANGGGFDNYIDNELNAREGGEEGGGSPTPAPLPYWTVHWCGTCDWNHAFSCDSRKAWIMDRYFLTEIEAMEGLRDQCAVGETHEPSGRFSRKPTAHPTLSPEMLWWSHHWCGNCTWNNFTSCDARKTFIRHWWGPKTELEAMEDLRDQCALSTHAPSVSSMPSSMPSGDPSGAPSPHPSARPSTAAPSDRPSASPSASPSGRPSASPSASPSGRPSASPSKSKTSPSTSSAPAVGNGLLH
jgi:hypothetical protein